MKWRLSSSKIVNGRIARQSPFGRVSFDVPSCSGVSKKILLQSSNEGKSGKIVVIARTSERTATRPSSMGYVLGDGSGTRSMFRRVSCFRWKARKAGRADLPYMYFREISLSLSKNLGQTLIVALVTVEA